MAKQCMVAAILYRPNMESSFSSEKNLQQSKNQTLTNDESSEKAEYEDLEKVTIGDDQEKFFQVGSQLPSPKNDKN